MSNIGTSEMAALTPYVKLIYRYRKKQNDPWTEMVVPFKSFTSEDEFKPNSLLKSKFSRGDGAGIPPDACRDPRAALVDGRRDHHRGDDRHRLHP